MKVELRQHTGRTLGRSGRTITLPQYRVFIDGRACGFIGWAEGSSLNLVVRFGPLEQKEIARQVAELLERDEPITAIPPEMPSEQPEQQEEMTNDFIDP